MIAVATSSSLTGSWFEMSSTTPHPNIPRSRSTTGEASTGIVDDGRDSRGHTSEGMSFPPSNLKPAKPTFGRSRVDISASAHAIDEEVDPEFIERHLRQLPIPMEVPQDIEKLLQAIQNNGAEKSLYQPVATLLTTLSKHIYGMFYTSF